MVLLPGGAWLWAVLLGAALGPMFPLTLTLPLDAGRRPADVAAFTGMMLGVGYTLSSCSPLVLGAIRDATGADVRSLPITREEMLRALEAAREKERRGAPAAV